MIRTETSLKNPKYGNLISLDNNLLFIFKCFCDYHIYSNKIQFLEFMSGSNVPQAFPKYFIALSYVDHACNRFISKILVHVFSDESVVSEAAA